ncbi:ABC transporter [Boudabousia liubingyangii]|uniref:Lipoprotein n=1 Tax=Boudabousia liubingyangii TaxID=1921764 RepID=A0A1Q5PK08_9ACTO|nr:MetQ/NlpA family ABC transporter substrate-binding protein [Boudabousia liubingyangii]OKL46548.1 ABC transporter [Boudabousia liubingyangii]OKL46867.1 ABC transporter [Boudabousia liubingyangii]
MRKFNKALVVPAVALALTLGACSSSTEQKAETKSADGKELTTVVVGASPVPHAKILEYIQENLAEKNGLKLEIKTFDDYILPNEALASKELDANYFQTVPYLKTQSEKRGYKFEAGKGVHLEPLAVYSKKLKAVEELPEGGKIGIISDPTNQERALRLLAQAKLVEIPASGEVNVNTVKKLKNFEFAEVAGPQLARSLDDVDLGVLNGNFAQEAGLAPKKDGLLVEATENNPASNLLVWREGDNNPGVQKLEELLHSQEVKDYIEKTWDDGSVIPTF